MRRVVILGAGHAGTRAAVALRDAGHRGTIVLVDAQVEPPYQRPPLSKDLLARAVKPDALRFHGPSFYADRGIELVLGERAVQIERWAAAVHLESGRTLPYDHLVLALGCRPRTLPSTVSAEAPALRTQRDSVRLADQLDRAESVLIVGGGLIGLEVAAYAGSLGKVTTVLEAAERLLPALVSPATSSALADHHRSAGVRLLTDTAVEALLTETGGAVRGAATDFGDHVADVVLVAAGVTPEVALAAAAGLEVDRGILVDERLRTSDPQVSAIGDCARFPSPDGSTVRLESVQNATDHARRLAHDLTGGAEVPAEVPSFWSQQGSLRLQVSGIPNQESLDVVRGDPATLRFSVLRFHGNRLRSVESIGHLGEHLAARRILKQRGELTPDQAADPGFDLKAAGAGTP